MVRTFTPSFISRGAKDFSVRNMVFQSKPEIQIKLDDDEDDQGSSGKPPKTYSTLDQINGTVSITARNETRYDGIDVVLVGLTRTYVDKMNSHATISGRTEATHRFLKLALPPDESDMPQSGLLEAGKTYTFKFTFVVPVRLLDRSCVHPVRNLTVRDAHLRLPPSMGDAQSSSIGSMLLDDLCPEMAKIRYMIKARLTRSRENGKDDELAEATKVLRIRPSSEEQPPLITDGRSKEYRLRREKMLRKGLFKGKMGSLVMEASQPKSFCLAKLAQENRETQAPSTYVQLQLRFDPRNSRCSPPCLSSLANKLKVSTFFSTTTRRDFPNRRKMIEDLSLSVLSDMLPLSQLSITSVEWKCHDPTQTGCSTASDEANCRRSAFSTMSGLSALTDSSEAKFPSPSSSYRPDSVFYTASIIVPLSLPSNKDLGPTFHSCLVSRTYTIHLSLLLSQHPDEKSKKTNHKHNHHSHRRLVPCSRRLLPRLPRLSLPRRNPARLIPLLGRRMLVLKLPVQVSAAGSAEGNERLRRYTLAEQAISDADAAFLPRPVGPASWSADDHELLLGADDVGDHAARAPPPVYEDSTVRLSRNAVIGQFAVQS